ncbi:MAG: hypothetical protein KAJ40_07725 [Alphaproteobacteria bacterium]|nr:hypothetical protein [Alphaproteobacteria bacterium]
MPIFKKLALFFSCNIIGFFLPLILYPLCLKLRIINIEAEGFDTSGFFIGTTEIPDVGMVPIPVTVYFPILTWVFCALFSFAYFFVSKKWQRIFLFAPLIMPLVQSLLILIRFI